jgi:hypothetical protein
MDRVIRTMVAIAPAILLACALPRHAVAQMAGSAEHMNASLGFHRVEAPIGTRWWFSGQKVALDVGVGFGSDPAPGYADENIGHWAFELGVPFRIHSWPRVHVLLRPGLLYTSQEEVVSAGPPDPFDTSSRTSLSLLGELEAEVFLVDNVSVSASHGIAYTNVDPAGPGDSFSTFDTIGNNFTTIGFHVYFFGGGQ